MAVSASASTLVPTSTGLSAQARKLCVWCVIGMGFVLPVTPAGTSLLLALALLFWLASGNWRAKSAALRASPVALGFLAFCGLMLLGACYGQGSSDETRRYLVKYLSLLLVPLLVSLELSAREKLGACAAFCAAMLLTLLISTLIWLDAFSDPGAWFSSATRINPVVFKLSITHSFFMAFAAYFLALAAAHWHQTRWFWPLLALALLASANVLFMVPGRTGYVTLGLLLLSLFHQRFGRRGLAVGALAALVLAGAAYETAPIFRDRVNEATAQATHWQAGRGDPTSIGLRLDYYTNTLAIIRSAPLFGVGIGGFPSAYDAQVRGTAMAPSNNPHNQYLLLTAQMGVLGLLALLAVYAVQWRAARRLAAPFAQLALAVLLGFMVGNLFNSFMLDMAERMFFAWMTGLLFSGKLATRDVQNG